MHAFWLDLYGVYGDRRRDLSRELATNLAEAATRTSPAAAVAGVGSVRALAVESAGSSSSPAVRWARAAMWALVAFYLALAVEFVAWTAWNDAAEASGAARVTGELSLFPGASATFERAADGTPGSTFLDVGLAVPFGVAAVALVLTARPWNDLRPRASARRSGAVG